MILPGLDSLLLLNEDYLIWIVLLHYYKLFSMNTLSSANLYLLCFFVLLYHEQFFIRSKSVPEL